MTFGPSSVPDDRPLVAAFVREREERAFRELYRRHTPRLYPLVRRLVGGGDSDVADVVQETWLRAAERLAGFEWRSALGTWLASIAINCARELIRRRARQRETSLAEPPDGNPWRAASASHPLDLERALAHLPDGFREILVLHDVEGFTHEEISRQLGIEIGTSKSQLHRARKRMRELLAG
ncbi:MAG: RNA polymerase sigma factor [Terriglobia bacterium]